MPLEMNRIKKYYLVLCEGKDAVNFLIPYWNSDALNSDARFRADLQAMDFGGVEQLAQYLQLLQKMEGFSEVRRILILRDAEKDKDQACRMIQSALQNNGFLTPDSCNVWRGDNDGLQVAYSLFPACSDTPIAGTLEDLCWDILKDPNAMEFRKDIQAFISGIKRKYNTLSTYEHKGRLHTFFSVNDRFVSLKIGEAASAGAFDWNSEKLTQLRSLIEAGFEA